MNMENTMFVLTYKIQETKVSAVGYRYLGISRNAYNVDFYDNTDDNISVKNPYYR